MGAERGLGMSLAEVLRGRRDAGEGSKRKSVAWSLPLLTLKEPSLATAKCADLPVPVAGEGTWSCQMESPEAD
jgi:hypothetical protein